MEKISAEMSQEKPIGIGPMEKKPFFSIIIPVYNVALYLRECLDSVLAQTFKDWEAICVDDGSTDESGKILDEYGARDKRFRVVHQGNAGVSAARNRGLEEAKGEWVWFLDGDDLILPGALTAYHGVVAAINAADAIISPYLMRFTATPPTAIQGSGAARLFAPERVTGESFWGEEAQRGYSPLRVIRRAHFAGIRFPEGVAIMEDEFFLISLLAVPSHWVFADIMPYGYRTREGSASFNLTPRRCAEFAIVLRDLYRFAQQKLNPTRESVLAFTNSMKPVFRYYYGKLISDAGIEEVCKSAEVYAEIEQLSKCPLLTIFMKARLYTITHFKTRRFFPVIKFCEYIFFGVRRRLLAVLVKCGICHHE